MIASSIICCDQCDPSVASMAANTAVDIDTESEGGYDSPSDDEEVDDEDGENVRTGRWQSQASYALTDWSMETCKKDFARRHWGSSALLPDRVEQSLATKLRWVQVEEGQEQLEGLRWQFRARYGPEVVALLKEVDEWWHAKDKENRPRPNWALPRYF